MTKGIFIMNPGLLNQVYPESVKKAIEERVEMVGLPMSAAEVEADYSLLQDVEVLFSGWGGPRMDQTFLDHAPNLKMVFYAAGTIKDIVTPASWKAGIRVTSANVANAVPVAEFTLSQILFSLKNGWQLTRELQRTHTYPRWPYPEVKGAYKSTVGLISLSAVGRKTNELLQQFDLEVLAYDPFVQEEEAKALQVKLVSLEELFEQADIVSLHAPLLEETTGMVTGKLIASMKEHATFINTARGAIVKEDEMIAVLKERPDLTAILDVTDPEPPVVDSPLYTLPNVVLTPHVAGSLNKEAGRMGEYMLEELKRYMNGQPVEWEITEEKFRRMA